MKDYYNLYIFLALLIAAFQLQAQDGEVTPCEARGNPVVFGDNTRTISLSANFDPPTFLIPFVTDVAGGAIQNFGCTPGDSALFFKLEVDPHTSYLEIDYVGGAPDVSIAVVQILDPQCPSQTGTSFQESVYLDELGNSMTDCAFDVTGNVLYSFCNSTSVLDETTLYLWVSTASGDGTVELDVTQYVAPDNDECANAVDLTRSTNLVYNEMSPACFTEPDPVTTLYGCEDEYAQRIPINQPCFDLNMEAAYSAIWYKFETDDSASELDLSIVHSNSNLAIDELAVAVFEFPEEVCDPSVDIPSESLLKCAIDENGDGIIDEAFQNIGIEPLKTYYILVMTPKENSGSFELCIDIDPPAPCNEDPARWYNHTNPLCGINGLDGACLKLTGNDQKPYPPGPIQWPGCPTVVLNNPNWVTFVASSDTLSLDITIDACQIGQGAQIAVYGPLDPTLEFDPSETIPGIEPAADQLLSLCSFTNCMQGTISLLMNDLTEGHIYGIVFDGCNGDICDVSIEVQDGGGFPKLEGTLDHLVINNPTEGSDSLCQGTTATFEILNDIVGASVMVWSLKDDRGSVAWDTITAADQDSIAEIARTFYIPGAYEMCVTATNFCDSTEEICIPFFILSDPIADFSFNIDSLMVSFLKDSSYGVSYSWDFGDGNTSQEESPVHTYSESGTYTVGLMAMNECDTVFYSREIGVGFIPNADFIIVGDSEGCPSLEVSFEDASQGNVTSWEWTFTGGTPATSNEANPTVMYDQAGLYDVSLRVSNSEGSHEFRVQGLVFVYEEAEGDFSFTKVNDFEVDFMGSLLADPNATIKWEFGDRNISTLQNVTHIYEEEGIYPVRFIVSNSCNSDTTEKELVISTVSVDESEFDKIISYPNPVKHFFTIDGFKGTAELVVRDLNGSHVLYRKNVESQERIYTIDWPSGIYYIYLMTLDRVVVHKIIVQQ